ncbi:hypothetical protein AAFF_G00298940 [Aldrovandia affinis]|uniref:NACHT domain-containing protein n=1 Tax=Aldrovandia affinis TaxID=143900 RepID=A0AAD7R939_9TELE|nr:hypothetical protein AAFF_G00298940 [Aldrovandia affinis]
MSATWDLAGTPLNSLHRLHREAMAAFGPESRDEGPFGGQCPREVVLSGQYVPLKVGKDKESGGERAGGVGSLQDAIDAAVSQGGARAGAVVMVGPAGVGKTTAVQRLLVDWAAGTRLLRFAFVFPIGPGGGELSLVDLLSRRYPHLSADALTPVLQNPAPLLFVLDGLDRYQRWWGNTAAPCSSPNLPAPFSSLVSGLVQGTLLPGASVLVTTRPTAALRPLPKFVGQRVEVRGLSRAGRRAYVGRFFPDEEEAAAVLRHLEETVGFYALARLPGFCWTLCSVYKAALGAGRDLPRTLTRVFADATAGLIRRHAVGEAPAGAVVSGLAKMAAHTPLHDTGACSPEEMTAFGLGPFLTSPFLSALVRVDGEPGAEGRAFSFLSPTAAQFLLAVSHYRGDSRGLLELLEETAGRAELLELFLAGLADPAQREPLEGAVGRFDDGRALGFSTWLRETTQEAVPSYHRERHHRCFRLLHQRQDAGLVLEAVGPSARLGLSYAGLSVEESVALGYVATCCGGLKQLNLYNSKTLREGVMLRLVPVIRISNKIILSQSNLSPGSYAHLTAGLRGGRATELDLSYNHSMGDQGLERLCAGLLGSSLQSLWLPVCSVTAAGCGYLATALCSSQLHLLDLRANSIGDLGLAQLSHALESPQCQLRDLRLQLCKLTGASMEALSSALRSGHSALRSLDLRQNSLSDEGMHWLCTALQDPRCSLETLHVFDCGLTGACCAGLADALRSGGGRLTELDLSVNELEDPGALKLCDVLKMADCALQKLRLTRCELGEGVFLELAARGGDSRLTELELGLNKVGDVGAKHLWEALQDPHCKLEHLDVEMVDLTDGCVVDVCAAVRASRTLKTLVLKNNGLTDAAVPDLVAMAQESRTLRELNLQYNDFSEDVFEIMDACGKIKY